MTPIEHTNQVLDKIASKTDKVVLFYSCGKDSIALLDMCSKKFKEVTAVFMYFVKDLENINKFIRFSEAKYPNVKFLQVPHWCLTHILQSGFFCVAQPQMKLRNLIDIAEMVKAKTNIGWSIYGMKQSDNMNRGIMLRTPEYEDQAINNKTQKVYPLSKWKDKEVLRYIRDNKLPTPINYEAKSKSSGVGFNLDVYLYLRKYYPADLEKILNVFPLSEKLLFEHDQQQSKKSKFVK